MKKIVTLTVTLLFLTISTLALAQQQAEPQAQTQTQTPVSPELSKAYYDSCMGKRDQRMSRESQDSLCECTAKKMQESMSVEEIYIMGQQNQQGRNVMNKMLLDVYTPCMQAPLAEMVRDQCIQDEKVDFGKMHKSDLCTCTADKTAVWFTTNGRDMMAEVLAADPNIYDPMEPVLNSVKFKQESMANMLACLPAKKGRK